MGGNGFFLLCSCYLFSFHSTTSQTLGLFGFCAQFVEIASRQLKFQEVLSSWNSGLKGNNYRNVIAVVNFSCRPSCSMYIKMESIENSWWYDQIIMINLSQCNLPKSPGQSAGLNAFREGISSSIEFRSTLSVMKCVFVLKAFFPNDNALMR